MDTENITTLIYQAVFITIFILASTITINLFLTINDYSSKVDTVVKADSISEVVSENESKMILTYDNNGKEVYVDELKYELVGYEVYSLANNYGLGKYDSDGKLIYTYGKKYAGKIKEKTADNVIEKNVSIDLPYKVTIKDKDGKYVTDISKIALTQKYSVEYITKAGSLNDVTSSKYRIIQLTEIK